MISYAEAKARAKANRTDWNERTCIKKATITWADEEWVTPHRVGRCPEGTEGTGTCQVYELEVENEDCMDDKEFTAWIEKNAESLAKEDAESNNTTFEELVEIDYEEDYIDDDAEFDADYDAYCEYEWESETGR